MKGYKVTITETLKMTVDIKANSRDEAEMIAESKWGNSDYILDAECFDNVTFKAKQVKEIER